MKKFFKYALIALLVIVLAVGGYVLYEFKFKSYDVADPEVDKIVQETYSLELPDGTTVTVDQDGNIVDEDGKVIDVTDDAFIQRLTAAAGIATSNTDATKDKGTSTNANSSTTTQDGNSKDNDSNTQQHVADGESNNEGKASDDDVKPADTSSTDSNKPTTNDVTVSTIKSKYEGSFNALSGQASSRLNSLIGQAKNEYNTKKNNGESVSYGYFYNKYMGAANSVEASTDAAFNALLRVVQADLKANGYDAAHAESFRTQYEAEKEALRSGLMGKVTGYK